MNRLEACLYLRFLPGIGPVKEQKLITHFSTPEAIFEASDKEWSALEGIGSRFLKIIRSWKQYQRAVEKQITLIKKGRFKFYFGVM